MNCGSIAKSGMLQNVVEMARETTTGLSSSDIHRSTLTAVRANGKTGAWVKSRSFDQLFGCGPKGPSKVTSLLRRKLSPPIVLLDTS